MKKIITVLAAAALVFGFAGIAAAGDCYTCVAPGTIDRACPIAEQGSCQSNPFDYEDQIDMGNNYCTLSKAPRRVLFPVCDCEPYKAGDTIDISLEILVNGQSGDNGAYWAESINSVDGIEMNTYSSNSEGCEDYYLENSRPYLDKSYGKAFVGPFRYLTAYGYGEPIEGNISCSSLDYGNNGVVSDDINRVTRIEPNFSIINDPDNCVEHGYTIDNDDDALNKEYWAINIPQIRFDQNYIQAGDVISVKICVGKAVEVTKNGEDCTNVDTGGVCGDAGCCCEFVLGTLGCCAEELVLGGHLIYPYATALDSTAWWFGMVITNVDDTDSEVSVTIYENDGDTKTITSADVPELAIPAHGMAIFNDQALSAAFGEDFGDSACWFEVNGDTTLSGFMFIANDNLAEAMGYLPVSRPFFDYYDQLISSGNGLP